MSDCLTLVLRVEDSFDIPLEDTFFLKPSMPEVPGFLLLLKNDVTCFGSVINLVFWVKSKGFNSRPPLN